MYLVMIGCCLVDREVLARAAAVAALVAFLLCQCVFQRGQSVFKCATFRVLNVVDTSTESIASLARHDRASTQQVRDDDAIRCTGPPK